MAKSADAFRTISEVADWLETPAHVLRFWESKFTQVKPVKRAGGRRYYRPQDMRLLGGIKRLLHDDGMTIKGVQKLLRDKGVRHVAALSAPLAGETEEDARAWAAEAAQPAKTPSPEPAQVLDFRRQEGTPEPEPEQKEPVESATDGQPDKPAIPETATEQRTSAFEPEAPQDERAEIPDAPPTVEEPLAEKPLAKESVADTPVAGKGELPAFLSRPAEEEPITRQADKTEEAEKEAEPAAPPAPRPAQIDVPPDPDDSELARPGILSRVIALPRPLPAPVAEAARPLLARLDALRAASGDE